jgi:hypothetical protein
MIVNEGSTDVDLLREELTFELIVLHTEVMELNKKWDFSVIFNEFQSIACRSGCSDGCHSEN